MLYIYVDIMFEIRKKRFEDANESKQAFELFFVINDSFIVVLLRLFFCVLGPSAVFSCSLQIRHLLTGQ